MYVRDLNLFTRLSGMEEALMHRVDPRAKLTENGRQYRGLTLLEMAREHFAARGLDASGDRMELAGRMLQTCTIPAEFAQRDGGMAGLADFVVLLANVANKRLRQAYAENPGTYKRWARRAPNAPDFRAMTVAQLSAMPDLLRVNEHGEFKYGTLSDGGESYALLTHGRILSFTRQAIVNDDLRAFDRIVTGFGAAAARLENRAVYAQLTANAPLSDGTALFHANHINLYSGGGSALQFAALSKARADMRRQVGMQGEELNVRPAWLIVPAALEQTAYQLTSDQVVPAAYADINEFRRGGRCALEPLVEPVLDANSSTAWYLAANGQQVDTVEYCHLEGAEGPVIEQQVRFQRDGVELKCRLDFVAKAIDFRGLYKAAGA